MEVSNRQQNYGLTGRGRAARFAYGFFYYLVIALCSISLLQSSLLITSQPLRVEEIAEVERAVDLLEARGFRGEAFWLRNLVVFRGTDSWLNAMSEKENAFAATNFPLNIVTLYPDFFNKAKDDTERAMILLHETRHLRGGSEHDAYGYAWRARRQIGWTILSHGTTNSYITVESHTREIVPELFTCADKIWNDCTENLPSKSAALAKTK